MKLYHGAIKNFYIYVEDVNMQCNVCFPAGFRVDRVPPALDAVVIGSGIGGLSAAALLSKAGKRVVVLEQHDQAGGCTHTFQNKGFEFDVGKKTNTHQQTFFACSCSVPFYSLTVSDFLPAGERSL